MTSKAQFTKCSRHQLMIAQSDITMEINPLEKSGRNQRQIRETGGRQWWVSAN